MTNLDSIKEAAVIEVQTALANGEAEEAPLILKASQELLEYALRYSSLQKAVREWLFDAQEWAEGVELRVREWLARRVVTLA